MTTTSTEIGATQRYQAYVNASPEAIWAAIVDPARNNQYGYKASSEYDLRQGGAFRGLANEGMRAYGSPDVVVVGEVIDVEPQRRLVQTWRMLFDEELASESTQLTYELEPGPGGVTKVTVTHELDGAPRTAAMVSGAVPDSGGGWPYILSDLKTLLETGSPLPDPMS
jgi:uncharacterized protein YndB with AHSA1/START domain